MSLIVIFIFGVVIFGAVILSFFLGFSENKSKTNKTNQVDPIDYDGSANWSRIPQWLPIRHYKPSSLSNYKLLHDFHLFAITMLYRITKILTLLQLTIIAHPYTQSINESL